MVSYGTYIYLFYGFNIGLLFCAFMKIELDNSIECIFKFNNALYCIMNKMIIYTIVMIMSIIIGPPIHLIYIIVEYISVYYTTQIMECYN